MKKSTEFSTGGIALSLGKEGITPSIFIQLFSWFLVWGSGVIEKNNWHKCAWLYIWLRIHFSMHFKSITSRYLHCHGARASRKCSSSPKLWHDVLQAYSITCTKLNYNYSTFPYNLFTLFFHGISNSCMSVLYHCKKMHLQASNGVEFYSLGTIQSCGIMKGRQNPLWFQISKFISWMNASFELNCRFKTTTTTTFFHKLCLFLGTKRQPTRVEGFSLCYWVLHLCWSMTISKSFNQWLYFP